jgi:hypothetical protein
MTRPAHRPSVEENRIACETLLRSAISREARAIIRAIYEGLTNVTDRA